MELTEDGIIQKYAKNCGHCNRNTLLPYEYEFNCFVCGYNVKKRKKRTLQNTTETMIFINRINYAEQKILCICIYVYKNYEGDDYDKIYEVLSTLKNKKLKTNNILCEKYKNMLENPDFEQNKYLINSTGIYKIGHDSIRLMKWICYYDRSYYKNII